MSKYDQLHRYVFNKASVRGELVQLHQTYRSILQSQDYPEIVQHLLGELLAAASLLTATLKFEGDIALQLQSEGFIKYAVINGTHQQSMRGVARWDEAIEHIPTSFAELFEKGVLVISITPEEGERYQGMVALDKDSLEECLESYFLQSEQLPTRVILKTQINKDTQAAGGLFLQIMPTSSAASDLTERPEFEHLRTLSETITAQELLYLPAHDILHRLYHQEELQVYAPQDVRFKCSCSRERSANAIASVDKQELLNIIAEEGSVKIKCQYCNTEYRFDAIDVQAVHSDSFAQPERSQ